MIFGLSGLKLIFLIVSRAVSLLGLSRREAWWKDAEIVMLRHQLAVAGRERLGARARLTWPDRALLALLAGTLPIDRLAAMRLIVTPGTILRWHRDIVRRRWSRRSAPAGPDARQRTGRSGGGARLARENESWGYRHIHGELAGLGITVAPSTVWQILKNVGIDPAPRGRGLAGPSSCGPGRGDPGAGLLHRRPAQRDEDLRPCRYRARHPPDTHPGSHRAPGPGVGGPAGPEPAHGPGGTERVKFVLHDRDADLTAAFDEVFRAAGAIMLSVLPFAASMNSIIERWVGSCHRELLDRTLVWNQRHLMIVLREYEDFYNHRPHRALKQAAPLRQLPDQHHRRMRSVPGPAARSRRGRGHHEYRLVA